MKYGKTIELFLVDGNPDGMMTAEISNWNGKGIKMPRIDVEKSTRDELQQAGVYFLICENKKVYIGEAENIQVRLKEHIRAYSAEKEDFYWATVLFFVSTDRHYLNKSFIRYLENKLFEEAKRAGKYELLTKKTFQNTILRESQKASMDEFFENICYLVKIMGYSILDVPAERNDQEKVFWCKSKSASAKGFESETGFTVLKDSLISDHVVESLKKNYATWFNEREAMTKDGTVVNRRFTKDYSFTSPSAASSIVLGRPSNGRVDWKMEDGTLLKDADR